MITKEEILKIIFSKFISFEKIEFNEENTQYLSNKLTNFDLSNKIIEFKNCIFKSNLRIDNLKCKELSFKDCRFLDGGGIKNRKENNNLKVENFIFKPYELQGDFVIDLGAYADEDSIINQKTGTIQHIKFANHQKGNGRVFFIGLTDKTKGDFRNSILDNVVFENCNLKNCTFSNSKVDKTEFKNVKFNKNINLPIMRIFPNAIESIIDTFLSIIVFMIIFIFIFIDASIDNINIIILTILVFISTFIALFAPLDTFYTWFLGITKFFDKQNNTYLNKHISTYDEILILKKLDNIEDKNYSSIIESLSALKELYDQLAINFGKTNKQLWGEFMYSSKFYQSIIDKENFINMFPNKFNHLINGYGRRWFRALWWILFTIFSFAFVFTYLVKPNIDYTSTKNTPYFLIKNAKIDKEGIVRYNEKSFNTSMKITRANYKDNILYGYDNRFNFNNIKEQKNLTLKENYQIGLLKSLSNLLQPFSFENKKWFENITSKSFVFSMIESIILWILILALFRALWNSIIY